MTCKNTYSKNLVGELLEGGRVDLELGLLNLDQHLVINTTDELTLVLVALASAAPVVEDGDLDHKQEEQKHQGHGTSS